MSDENELHLALKRFDLLAYVKEQGATRGTGFEYVLTCPRCFKEKLSVNTQDRQWRCFVCEKYKVGYDGRRHAEEGAGGVFALVKWLEGISGFQAAQKIIEASKPAWQDPNALPDLIPEGMLLEQRDSGERVATGLPKEALALPGILPYLTRRGITWDDVCSFNLCWVPPGRSWLSNRLLFPVRWQGQVLYWQARALWDKDENEQWAPGKPFKKTLNPAVYFCSHCGQHFPDDQCRPGGRCAFCNSPQQYGSADVLLNLEQACRFPRVAICEGPTSAIRAGPSAVCTFGKQLQPQQIAALVACGVRGVDFMWDGPSPTEPLGAWPEMLRAAAQLAPFLDVRCVFLPSEDPGSWPREWLDFWRAQARPFGLDKMALL